MLAAAVLAALGAPAARAQTCPAAAACTPGPAGAATGAVTAFNMGILNVTLGSINNTTLGQADGYQDYSCRAPGTTTATTLTVGQNYTLAVRTSLNNNETVLAWIDYNNDGAFDPVTEVIMAATPATGTGTAGGLHAATFAPPATARTGVPLRLRIAADYTNSPVPTPCSTPQFSQDEDYAVTLAASTGPPVAAFTTNGTTTCSGCVQFADASQGLPTSWVWSFGDGTASTAQNPSHCYAAAGTYRVQLTVANGNGNAISAATTITYPGTAPAATCAPATTAYCCLYGVVRVRLGALDNASADGSAGYQDFSCAQRATLTVGTTYTLQVTTGGTLPHDTRVYLDLNNDGAFAASELVGQALNTASPTFSLKLPATAPLGQPLRLRLVADYVGSDPQPCKAPTNGQVEDYSVVPAANLNPPVAAFASTYVSGGCVNPVQFTDQTTNAPTAWRWDFGDGTTSTQQNPTHQFAAGTYTVALTATSANGTSSTSRAGFVISVPCLSYCASNGTGFGAGTSSPLWITNVSAAPGGFSNASGLEPGGYGSYVAKTITLAAGTTATLTVGVSSVATHRTVAWADFNQDGIFADNELLFSTTASGNTYAGTFTLPATARLGSTRLRIETDQTTRAPDPCAADIANGEVEDYTLLVQPATPTATAATAALPGLTVAPNPTADGRLRLHLAGAGAPGPYAVEVQNLLGATLLTTAVRLAPGTDATLDLGPLAAGLYLLRLRDPQGQVAVRRVVRE
ncbi:PKD domain-containing protein [Hymenobacter nivis]|uniref:PKD domain-containing protein n=1 Tax=Hymenobacter nivis TaxID=1850093 RepID=A0A502GWY4_9BACT|nr:PKD domain-containing protein [Hymenobacter nivis]